MRDNLIINSEDAKKLRLNYINKLHCVNTITLTTFQRDILNGLTYLEKAGTDKNETCREFAKEKFKELQPKLKAYYFPNNRCPECLGRLETQTALFGCYVNNDIGKQGIISYNYKFCRKQNHVCSYSNKDMQYILTSKMIPPNWIQIENPF